MCVVKTRCGYRYQIIVNSQTKKPLGGDDKAKCNTIIKALKGEIDEEDVQVGVTKVCKREETKGGCRRWVGAWAVPFAPLPHVFTQAGDLRRKF